MYDVNKNDQIYTLVIWHCDKWSLYNKYLWTKKKYFVNKIVWNELLYKDWKAEIVE